MAKKSIVFITVPQFDGELRPTCSCGHIVLVNEVTRKCGFARGELDIIYFFLYLPFGRSHVLMLFL